MRRLWALLLVAAAALVPGSARSATATANLSVNIIPVSPIQVVQGASAGTDGGCYSSLTFNFSPAVPAGAVIVGVIKTEHGFSCSAPNGAFDTIKLGSQSATMLPEINPSNYGFDNCCPSDDPFILFNATGGQTSLVVTNSGGANFDGMGMVAVITGLASTASLDGANAVGGAMNGNYYDNNASTGTDSISSGTITPSHTGDFLYGFNNATYADLSAMSHGTGWTQGPNNENIGGSTKHPAQDEYIINYNSTSPVAATFGTTNATGEWPPIIIAIKPQ